MKVAAACAACFLAVSAIVTGPANAGLSSAVEDLLKSWLRDADRAPRPEPRDRRVPLPEIAAREAAQQQIDEAIGAAFDPRTQRFVEGRAVAVEDETNRESPCRRAGTWWPKFAFAEQRELTEWVLLYADSPMRPVKMYATPMTISCRVMGSDRQLFQVTQSLLFYYGLRLDGVRTGLHVKVIPPQMSLAGL